MVVFPSLSRCLLYSAMLTCVIVQNIGMAPAAMICSLHVWISFLSLAIVA